jgi:hypothetical protein
LVLGVGVGSASLVGVTEALVEVTILDELTTALLLVAAAVEEARPDEVRVRHTLRFTRGASTGTAAPASGD